MEINLHLVFPTVDTSSNPLRPRKSDFRYNYRFIGAENFRVVRTESAGKSTVDVVAIDRHFSIFDEILERWDFPRESKLAAQSRRIRARKCGTALDSLSHPKKRGYCYCNKGKSRQPMLLCTQCNGRFHLDCCGLDVGRLHRIPFEFHIFQTEFRFF